MRPAGFVLAFTVLALLLVQQKAHAEGWQPWRTVKDTHIAWHYRWNPDWGDYDIEIRNDNDSSVSLKFVVSSPKGKSTGFWSLKPGASASFLEKFPDGGPATVLRLQILESDSGD